MKKALTFSLLGLFVLLVVVPILWVVMTSFKDTNSIFNSPWALPSPAHPENYGSIWNNKDNPIKGPFVVSLIVSLVTLALLLPIGSMAAYVLARYKFKGSGLLLTLFVGGMMFPNLLAAVPLRVLANDLGLLNNLVGLVIIYVAYSLPFTIFVLHGFFTALPGELAEAAEIDGAGHTSTFTRVMMPLAKPGLIVVGIFNGIGLWNEYNLAKILLLKENYTLPLALANLVGQQVYNTNYGEIFAAMVMVMLPVLVVYWVFKERIQEAMLAGAIK